jgi:hypothetical protein
MTTTYVSADDVIAHLGVTGSAGTSYTVYGLPVLSATLQAHVDHANTYVNALLGSDLNSSDPRYNVAKLAALDLACMGVLVVSIGGSLVGAYDYFLGDLRVARAGPYAFAIKQAIQGFSDDLQKQIVNLAPCVKTSEASMKDDVPTYRGGLMNP